MIPAYMVGSVSQYSGQALNQVHHLKQDNKHEFENVKPCGDAFGKVYYAQCAKDMGDEVEHCIARGFDILAAYLQVLVTEYRNQSITCS